MDKAYFYQDNASETPVLKTAPHRVGFDLVQRVFNERRPVKSLVRHIELWLESVKWAWFEDHEAWLSEKAQIEHQAETVERARDEDGHFVADDPETLENEAYEGGVSPDQLLAQLRPEPVYDEPSVALVKPLLLARVNQRSEAALKVIRDQYPDYEQLSWDKQESQARAWLADDTVVTPLVDAIAERRQLDKTELCQRIVAKADAYEAQVGAVIGERQALEDQVAQVARWSDLMPLIQ